MSDAGLSGGGIFFDGQSAGGRHVDIRLEAKELVIAAAGEVLARWPLSALVLLSEGPLRLGLRGRDGVLTITDPALRAALKAAIPRLFRSGFWRTARLGFVLALVSVAIGGVLYFGLPRAAEAIVPFIPPSAEARLGANYRASVEARFPACALDPKADAALKALTARLLAGTDLPFAPTVDLIGMPIENAFALPGGHVVVTLSLIAAMDSPDELAGVLAHEFGHVIERHVMIGVVEDAGLNLIVTLAAGGSNSSALGGASLLAQLSYSRRLEARADAHGLALLDQAKIGTKGFATLLARLEKDQSAKVGFSIPAILNSHPPSPERAARATAADLPGTTPAMDAASWTAVKAACVTPETPDKPKADKQQEKPKRK